MTRGMELSEAQIRRYSRHILLPDVGGVGQQRLLAARVAIDVTPPLASAAVALAYCAAAGIGHLRLTGAVDDPVTPDDVRVAILLASDDLGRPRAEALAARLRALNPDVDVAPGDAALRLDAPATDDVADALIAGGAAAARLVAALARGELQS